MKTLILTLAAAVACAFFTSCSTGASVSTADHTVSASTGIY